MLDLRIGLKQGQWEELERHLYEVSSPFHSRYGKHMSADEVNELVAPQASTIDSVHAWLEQSGCDSSRLEYSPARDWIKLSLPVSSVENLLRTNYSVYRHEDGTELIRTPQWSLPSHLHEHISTIQPTNSFLRLSAMRSFSRISAGDMIGAQAPEYQDAKKFYATADLVGPLQLSTNSVDTVCNVSAVTPTCLRTLYKSIDYMYVKYICVGQKSSESSDRPQGVLDTQGSFRFPA